MLIVRKSNLNKLSTYGFKYGVFQDIFKQEPCLYMKYGNDALHICMSEFDKNNLAYLHITHTNDYKTKAAFIDNILIDLIKAGVVEKG